MTSPNAFDPVAAPAATLERRARPPWRVLAGLAGVAVLLHGLLLAGVMAGATGLGGAGPEDGAAKAMQVRALPAAAADAAGEPPAASPIAAPTAALPVTKAATAGVETGGPRPMAQAPSAPVVRAAAGAGDVMVAAEAKPSTSPTAASSAVETAASAPAADTVADTSDAPTAADAAVRAAALPPGGPAAPAAPQVTAPAAGTGAPHPPAGTEHANPRDDEMPVYKTAFPPPLTLHYDLRRGLLSGTGTLVWRPVGDHYELRLEGRVAGLNVLTQVSQGGFDEAGIAPRRYTDQRMNREARAANFQREHGKITFSGPSNEFALLVGTQDRLSWMVQLAAIVSAEPRRLAAGGKVAIHVVGARGDAAMWVFRSSGSETVDTPGGAVRAAKFTREPRGAHDTLAEAWLDPARHGLPVRARIGGGEGGEALELSLRDLQLP